MLTAHTSLTMCTQKMMWLNWCNFFRLRRPGRAPTPSWWGRSSWRHHNPLAETSILTHGCTSKSRPCHPSVQALPCGQRAPGPLHLHLHWHPQEHSSPCCFSPLLGSQRGCSPAGPVYRLLPSWSFLGLALLWDPCSLEEEPVWAEHGVACRKEAPRQATRSSVRRPWLFPSCKPATNLQNSCSNRQRFLLFRDKEEEVKSSCLYAERT